MSVLYEPDEIQSETVTMTMKEYKSIQKTCNYKIKDPIFDFAPSPNHWSFLQNVGHNAFFFLETLKPLNLSYIFLSGWLVRVLEHVQTSYFVNPSF